VKGAAWRFADVRPWRPTPLLTAFQAGFPDQESVGFSIARPARGSPHGGVFLDIAWIKDRIPNAPEHIKGKLPGVYHQFKELADLDITEEPMEVGPTTHYMMGGVRVDADSQMSTVPELFAAGECGAGLHGANRLGGNSLSDLIVFGQWAGQYARTSGCRHGEPRIPSRMVRHARPAQPAHRLRGDRAALERTESRGAHTRRPREQGSGVG